MSPPRSTRRTTSTAPLAVLALAALLAGARDPLDEARAAYAQGRFDDALQQFAAAADGYGDEAPPALLHDLALAALRCGETARAERALDALDERGDPALVGRVLLLRGQLAWERCRVAAAQARGPEAEPFAYDVALALAAAARDAWQAAATTQADWPPARRNVERALQLVRRLEREKERAAEEARRASAERGAPQPVVLAPPDAGTADERERPGEGEPAADAGRQPDLAEPSDDELAALRQRLQELEAERREVRDETRRRRRVPVERDW